MKKQLASLFVAAFLAASLLLTSCKGQEDSSPKVEESSSKPADASGNSSEADSSTPDSAGEPYSLPLVSGGSVTISISSLTVRSRGIPTPITFRCGQSWRRRPESRSTGA